MTTEAPLEIKVVYDGRSRRGRKRVHAVTGRKQRGPVWVLVGGLNLIAAAALCYIAWWPVDAFLGETIFWKTPVPVDADAAAGMLFPALAKATNNDPPPEPDETLPEWDAAFSGRTAGMVIVTSAYSWLTLATIASCTLALAGGAACGRRGGLGLRIIGLILALGAALFMVWKGYTIWAEVDFSMEFPTSKWRLGMAGLAVLLALISITAARGRRGLTRLAGITLIALAAGSVVGLYLGQQSGAVELKETLLSPLPLIFVLSQALWGLALLPIASRAGR